MNDFNLIHSPLLGQAIYYDGWKVGILLKNAPATVLARVEDALRSHDDNALDNANAEIMRLEDELDDAKARIAELEAEPKELEDAKARIAELKVELKELEAELGKA